MYLFFESSKGVLKFSGRRTGADYFFIKEINGLGLPTRSYHVTEFANQPGQELILQKDEARIITLLVDVRTQKLRRQELKHIAEILYHPGELTVHLGDEQRKIACRCVELEEESRYGNFVSSFILQFICDKPYFTDEKPQQVNLFYRTDLIESSFILPCLFTKRVNKCTVINQGDVQAEPVFTICSMSTSEDTLANDANLAILNHTTGKQLLLETSVAPGEIITVDIPSRKVTSNVSGNVISVLSPDSYLADFCLAEGPNLLEVVSYNTEQNISVILSYENQYVAAFF